MGPLPWIVCSTISNPGERFSITTQTHQVRQLEVVTAGSPGVAISLIPQETAMEQVIDNPGGQNEKVRSRTATADYMKQEATE